MKNKRIDSFFKSDKREDTREDENRTNSTLPDILKHDTNDLIVQLEEPFFKVQRIISDEFHINSSERDPRKQSMHKSARTVYSSKPLLTQFVG